MLLEGESAKRVLVKNKNQMQEDAFVLRKVKGKREIKIFFIGVLAEHSAFCSVLFASKP